jgi:hypothetical protein
MWNKVVPEDDKTQSPNQSSGYHDDDVGIVLTMLEHLISQIPGHIRCANVVIALTIPMHLAVQNLLIQAMLSPSDAFS